MSLDSKIAILLSQLKNNPELKNASSTGPKVTSTTLSLEPLFAGLEQNSPMLAGAASLINDPTFLNVELDLFVLLKEQLTSTVKLIDVIGFSQDKAFREVIEGREDVSRKAGRFLRDVVEIDQFLQFLKGFKLEDKITFAESQEFVEHKRFLSQLKTLERVSRKTAVQRREVVEALDALLDARLYKVKTEKVSVRNNILNPKGLLKSERVGVISLPPKVTRSGTPPKEILDLLIKVGLAPTKQVLDQLKTRIYALTARSRVKADRVYVKDSELIKISLGKEELIDTLDKTARKIQLLKNSSAKIRTNNLVAKAVYQADKVEALSFTKKRTEKTQEEIISAKIFNIFKTNKTLFEQYTIRESVLSASKFKFAVDKLFSTIFTSRDSSKPVSDTASTILKVFVNPNIATKEEINVVTSILTPKSRILAEKLIFNEFVKFEMPLRIFSIVNLQIQLARFLNKRIILPEVAEVKDNTLATAADVITDRVGVLNKDRDAGGIGDISFLFSTQLFQYLALVQEVKKEAQKPRKDRVSIQDFILTPRFRSAASRLGIAEKSVIHFNKVPSELLQIDTKVVKNVDKPITEKPYARSLTLTPAIAQIITERFLADDSFNPYLFNKGPTDTSVQIKDETTTIQEKNGITDTLSSSQVGYAWMRDEEYTRGAYFLQPYVATIPPGRSRQF